MNKVVVGGIFGLTLLGVSAAAVAEGSGLGVGVKAGTLGLGAEITKSFTSSINGRLGLNSYTFTTSGSESGIDYDTDLKWQSTAALLDWHVFEGSFRLTAGYVFNANKLEMTNTTGGPTVEIGGNTYGITPGDLNGSVEFANGPYVGFGWGNAGDGKGLGFSLEIGALYQGSPDVSLTAAASTGITAADLREEERQLEDSLKDFKWYPQVALGISYAF